MFLYISAEHNTGTCKPEQNCLLYLDPQTSLVLCVCSCVIHIPDALTKSFPPFSWSFVANDLESFAVSPLVKTGGRHSRAWVDWYMDWEKKKHHKNNLPPKKTKTKSNAPATQVAGTCCLEGAMQLSLFLQFNVAWPVSPVRNPGVKEQSVLDFFFFSCGQDYLLWTPVEASPVALLSRSSGNLVCDTPLFGLQCVRVVLKQSV